MAAAVSDYIPAYPQAKKLKKEALGEEWNLELKQNSDILASIDKEGISVVGFKAEMDEQSAHKNASGMIQSKGVDAVCLNILKDAKSFGTDTNSIDFITKDKIKNIPESDKLSVAFEILEAAKEI